MMPAVLLLRRKQQIKRRGHSSVPSRDLPGYGGGTSVEVARKCHPHRSVSNLAKSPVGVFPWDLQVCPETLASGGKTA